MAEFAAVLDGDRHVGADGVLRALRPGTGTPLFCVHPAAGLSWVYTGLARHVGTPVHGVEARGVDDVSAPLPDSVGAMADDYLAEIVRVQPHGPYRLAGWSFGGVVAQAVATRLAAIGAEVALLALLDAYPAGARVAPGEADEEHVRRVVQDFAGADQASSALDLAAITRVYANNDRLLRTHVPDEYEGDVLLVVASGGPDVTDRWSPYLTGQVTRHDLPCGHDELLRPGWAERVARVLDRHPRREGWQCTTR